MNFANTYLKSFGYCKVLSWKSSVYADFERKELTYRGRLLAAVEVPTIRQINALVLIRGNSKAEVQQKLNAISAWLYGAGTDKLYAEGDNTYYFLARCTKVSVPEYSGNSARITVTFTCADNRLYASYNDQPITTATSEMNNFTFAGKHCLNDMGCVFVLDSMDAVPAIHANKYEISGMSGTLRYEGDEPRYKERQMTGTLYFVKQTANDGLMSDEEIAAKLHDIASWLGNAGRSSLVLDSDISREYEAEYVDGATFSRKEWDNGLVKLKFVLQPHCNDIATTQMSKLLTLAANSASTISLAELIPKGIGATTPIKVIIKNTGSTSISDLSIYYYSEKNVLKRFRLNGQSFTLAGGESVTVDSLSCDVMKGTTQGVKWLKSGDFPSIPANGTKNIRIMANVAGSVEVTVSCKVRWL